jgi:hypothetical protein
MQGALLALVIVSPFTLFIGLYQCFNNGQLPCVDTTNIDNHNRIVPQD